VSINKAKNVSEIYLAITTRLNIISPSITSKWIVDCNHVGKGDKTIVYLGRYLYRGVVREKDILACFTQRL